MIETTRASADRLVVLLPSDPAGSDGAADWWLVRGGAIIESGSGREWSIHASDRLLVQVGLAPTGALRIAFPDTPAQAGDRQRVAIARLAALDSSISDPATLHAVAAPLGGKASGTLVVLVANDIMLGWLDWAKRNGLRLEHVAPAAMILPLGETWRRAALGGDRMLGRAGCIIADEPGLADALLDGPVEPLNQDEVEGAVVKLATDPSPDLRSGRFARRRLLVDRSQWRPIGLLAASLVLVSTLVALVEIVKLERSTARLDAETLAVAQRIAGPAATLESAEALVANRAGPSATSVSASFAGLLARLAAEPDVSVANLAASSGTIRATLASPTPDQANRVFQALQRDGYRVNAAPRQSTDGRTMIDLTIGLGS